VEPADDEELATIMRLIDEAQLPRVSSEEDSATYETSLSEFEAWVRKMDRDGLDDPPDGNVPDSQSWRHDDDDEQDAEKIAA
jgi:hypothetical protein